jgi:hypothetical protein
MGRGSVGARLLLQHGGRPRSGPGLRAGADPHRIACRDRAAAGRAAGRSAARLPAGALCHPQPDPGPAGQCAGGTASCGSGYRRAAPGGRRPARPAGRGVDGGHGPHRDCRGRAQADAGNRRGACASLGLDLGQVARQMEAGLEGVTGGSLLEGTEELPVRVRLGAGLRGDPVAIGDMPILPPGAAAVAGAGQFPAVPLSTLGTLRLEPSESTITRRNGERVNTVQAFLMPGVLPAVALAEAMGAGRGRLRPAAGYPAGNRRGLVMRAIQHRAGADRAPGPDHHPVDRGRGDDLQLLPPDADRLCGRGPVGGAVDAGAGDL